MARPLALYDQRCRGAGGVGLSGDGCRVTVERAVGRDRAAEQEPPLCQLVGAPWWLPSGVGAVDAALPSLSTTGDR